MTQCLKLNQATFYIAGTFEHGAQRDVAMLIEAHGGKATRVFRTSVVTCLVAGKRCDSYKNKARSRDIPIINEAQLMMLIERGELELTPEEFIATEFDISQAIAELRSIFDGPPSSKTWTRCVEIIEQCDASHEAELIAYMTPFLHRWDALKMKPWQPPKKHAMMSGISTTFWPSALLAPELRVAPPIWILEMLRGEYSPKHSLARLINIHYAHANSGRLVALLKNPHLTRMHTLVLGKQNTCGKGFFQTLRTHPNSRSIHTLYIDIYDEQARAYFLEVMANPTHELTSIERLYVWSDLFYLSDPESIQKLPAFTHARIEFGEWQNKAMGWSKIGESTSER
jgi:hypothetical protein